MLYETSLGHLRLPEGFVAMMLKLQELLKLHFLEGTKKPNRICWITMCICIRTSPSLTIKILFMGKEEAHFLQLCKIRKL